MNKEKITELAQKYLNGTATPQELEQLHRWYDNWEDTEETILSHQAGTEETIRLRIWNRIGEKLQDEKQQPPFAVSITKRRIYRITAAVAVLIIVAAGSFFLLNKNEQAPAVASSKTLPANDIAAPGTTKARITLADGSSIYLDSVHKGTLVQQGNTTLVKLANGQLAYQPVASGVINEEIKYNTLLNPKGSKVIDMTLADGSRVWLDAGSAVTYPVAFTGKERKVTLTGEAYFEIAHDEAKPFYVSKGALSVQVLGTRFNVNAYDDEQELKVTLLEGAVKVSQLITHHSRFIKPGQQVVLTASDQLSTNNVVDIDAVMAWKNGKFIFGDKADIQTIMRQIARWYDVEVDYAETVNGYIGGSISRQVNASQVLKMLEMTGAVRFEISGKKVRVLKGTQ
jgi:transmembrane sensor